ncbi:hypothetical protein E2320_018551, partial [Naja naja]
SRSISARRSRSLSPRRSRSISPLVRHQEALEEVSVLKEWIRMAKNMLGKVLFT